jgi:tetratricopeptide (TPR) repeat protein
LLVLTRGREAYSALYSNLGNYDIYRIYEQGAAGDPDGMLVDRAAALVASARYASDLNPSAALGEARLSILEGDMPAAASALLQHDQPYHLVVKWLTGNVLYNLGDEQAASELWNQAGFGNTIFIWGQVPVGEEFWEEPFNLSSINIEILVNPANPDAYYKRAVVSSRQGDLTQAEFNIKKALSLKPNLWYYHLLLARVLDKAGRAPEALAEYELVLAANPGLEQVRNRVLQLKKEIY